METYLYNHHLYTRLKTKVAIEKNMHEAYKLIGDTDKTRKSFHKIIDGELRLSLIRLDFLRHRGSFEMIPNFF